MPLTEISVDAYRFRRLNDQDSNLPARPRNIAKVEPYSMNTNAVRPLYQSPPSQLITEAPAVPTKARIHLNSMGNTPTNSSTSSSAGSLGGMIHHSDFLTPNLSYSKPLSQPFATFSSSSYPAPPISFSDLLSHGSLHQLPAANIPAYNGHMTGMTALKNQSSIQGDLQPSMVRLRHR